MPDRRLKHATAMVARRTAPRKGFLNADLSTLAKVPDEDDRSPRSQTASTSIFSGSTANTASKPTSRVPPRKGVNFSIDPTKPTIARPHEITGRNSKKTTLPVKNHATRPLWVSSPHARPCCRSKCHPRSLASHLKSTPHLHNEDVRNS